MSDPENKMLPPAWTPGLIEQAIDRSQRRTLRDIILEVINESTGTRSNQFIVDVMSYIRDNNLEINTQNLVEEIDACINDGLIMEIDYTVPESNWRIRSLLLPKDSQLINITNHGKDGRIFLSITAEHFRMLQKWEANNTSIPIELIAALSAAVKRVADVLATRDLPNDGVKGIV